MRWSDSGKEASFFGVNYTLPFAHAYRAIGYLGLDRKKAIDRDVYHMARLCLNAYRIHIWDVEISDGEGHLIDNEHLDLLDYLIARLKERGIYILLTAQTNFGNGYPEPDQPTPGFSYLYDKCHIHSIPEAIAAQERYLTALVQHVNRYTGLAYQEDPFIIGFEINNEPCHTGSVSETKAYICRLLTALQKAGNRKPVFYNASQSSVQAEAYYTSPLAGTTFQWYPTGLVAGHTRKGNFLPQVDSYQIPFSNVKGFDRKARLIYEFDPADVLYSCLYPAMVRSFRTAGFQWITQFAYDPIDLAWANTEYQTHFLNLAYTPQKAISLKIAAEAARRLPRGQAYGMYPRDTLFGSFRVSYKENLSEMNTADGFFYSNNTVTEPVNRLSLQSIAGCGSSPVVHYTGTGAYFLDRIDTGLWRLEVMPDAVLVNDPFAKPSLKKEVAVAFFKKHKMTVELPDLGAHFNVTGINEGNHWTAVARDGLIEGLMPGVYWLQAETHTAGLPDRASAWKNIRLNEYVAPLRSSNAEFYVVHQPRFSVEAGQALTLEAVVAGREDPDSVRVISETKSFGGGPSFSIVMKEIKPYTWQGTIPGGWVKGDHIGYYLVVFKGRPRWTYPAGVEGHRRIGILRRLRAGNPGGQQAGSGGIVYGSRGQGCDEAYSLSNKNRYLLVA